MIFTQQQTKKQTIRGIEKVMNCTSTRPSLCTGESGHWSRSDRHVGCLLHCTVNDGKLGYTCLDSSSSRRNSTEPPRPRSSLIGSSSLSVTWDSSRTGPTNSSRLPGRAPSPGAASQPTLSPPARLPTRRTPFPPSRSPELSSGRSHHPLRRLGSLLG